MHSLGLGQQMETKKDCSAQKIKTKVKVKHSVEFLWKKRLDPQKKLRKRDEKQKHSVSTCQYRYHKLQEQNWSGRSFEISP